MLRQNNINNSELLINIKNFLSDQSFGINN